MAKMKTDLVLSLETKRGELAILKAEVNRLFAAVAEERRIAREARKARDEAKALAAIERAQKRLEKLASVKPVGAKAIRAAKRPSEVVDVPVA